MPAMTLTSARPVIGISAYSQNARWAHWDLPAVLLPQQVHRHGRPGRRPAGPAAAAGRGGRGAAPAGRPGAVRWRRPGPGPLRRGARHADRACQPGPGQCRGWSSAGTRWPADCRCSASAAACRSSTSRSAAPCTSTCRIWSVTTATRPRRHGYGSHKVSVASGSQLAAVLGRSEAAVPTHHHQAIDRLGGGLVATAWTDDGVIEAVEYRQPDEHPGSS